jgi:nitrogen fixation protein FixH
MNNNNIGKIWAYSVGFSIILVFGFCVATVVITSQVPVQETNEYMTNYQKAEINANDYINSRIAFDKKYKIKYISSAMKESASSVKYKVEDLNNNLVKNAKLEIMLSRPETHEFDQKLTNTHYKNGVYIFSDVKFPKKGVWDIIAKVTIGKDSRFYNIKIDTRNNQFREYLR